MEVGQLIEYNIRNISLEKLFPKFGGDTFPRPFSQKLKLSISPDQYTAQKMKFFIKDFFSKCDHIRKKLRIWSHLLKKSLIENFIFGAVIA